MKFEEALNEFMVQTINVRNVVVTAKFTGFRSGLAANAGSNKNCDTCYAEIKNIHVELAAALLLFKDQSLAIAGIAGPLIERSNFKK
ncbi:hypothetical protein ACHAW5_004315 [Stephanodiscus triporus]|uniref:Uncharacterized protein n=1 Tax=Stephanodiscus triporus TaxID=2934178 RepID=A0ABD3QIK4_9STRA